jgi:hypothetical protein
VRTRAGVIHAPSTTTRIHSPARSERCRINTKHHRAPSLQLPTLAWNVSYLSCMLIDMLHTLPHLLLPLLALSPCLFNPATASPQEHPEGQASYTADPPLILPGHQDVLAPPPQIKEFDLVRSWAGLRSHNYRLTLGRRYGISSTMEPTSIQTYTGD